MTSIVVPVIRKNALVATLWLCLLAGAAAPAPAQFLCSAGTRDGLTCAGDEECPNGGVCVIPLGVCSGGESDGFFCACPTSECVAEPVCPEDPSLGLCLGGVFEDLCCPVSLNCFDGRPCAATQKLCIGGVNKGFPCITNAHCPRSLCRSTGRFCLGGDFDSFACVDDADCPGGECSGPLVIPTTPAITRSPTPTRPTPTRTSTAATATPPTATTVPATPTPTPTGTLATVVPTTAAPTATRTPTRTPGLTVVPTNTPHPTRTPSVGQFVEVLADAPVGSNRVAIDLTATEMITFPVEGVIQVFGQQIGFTRRRSSNILNLTAQDGLPASLVAGEAILVIEATPVPQRPGGVIVRTEQGGSCAISQGPAGSGLPLLLGLGLLALYTSRRRI